MLGDDLYVHHTHGLLYIHISEDMNEATKRNPPLPQGELVVILTVDLFPKPVDRYSSVKTASLHFNFQRTKEELSPV